MERLWFLLICAAQQGMVPLPSFQTHLHPECCSASFSVVDVQGFGNVGAWAARLLSEHGGIIVAISDASGCVYDDSPEGIDVAKLLRHVHRGEPLPLYPHGQHLLRDEIFDAQCDVFVPAALGGVIDGVLYTFPKCTLF